MKIEEKRRRKIQVIITEFNGTRCIMYGNSIVSEKTTHPDDDNLFHSVG